jgi:hemerythrin-like domain-containing protein
MASKKSSASSKKAPSRAAAPKTPDAIALLKADHEKVRGLLSDLEKANAPTRRVKLLTQIDQELRVHTQIEEEIFYPAFRDAVKKKDDREMYYEAKEEHHVVKLVLPEILETPPTADEFPAKAKVLKELVEHHADEEEKEMFPKARKVIDREELRDLGARMAARKAELTGKS